MKLARLPHLALPALLPAPLAALAALMPLAGAQEAVDAPAAPRDFARPAAVAAAPAPPAVPGAAGMSDAEVLARAAEILGELGRGDESAAVAAVAAEMSSSASSLEERAEALMEADINELDTRLAVIELLADGYAAAGRMGESESMAFFASVGDPANRNRGGSPSMPKYLAEAPGTIMDNLVDIVFRGSGMFYSLDAQVAERLALRLGSFYVARDARAETTVAAAVDATEEVPSEPAAPLSGLGYVSDPAEESADDQPTANAEGLPDFRVIENRVPAIRLAVEAYDYPVAQRSAEGRARMEWMLRLGESRLSETGVDAGPMPAGMTGMSVLIGDIRRAGAFHAQNDDERSAIVCLGLADYYEKREAGEIEDLSANDRRATGAVGMDTEPEAQDADAERANQQAELEARLEELRAARAALEAQINDMREQMKNDR